MFRSTLNKGFQLTFKNNLTISVQFGEGNYCSNRNKVCKEDICESNTAEIAIWDNEGNDYSFGADSIKGWVDSNEVAEWIAKVSKAKNIYTI